MPRSPLRFLLVAIVCRLCPSASRSPATGSLIRANGKAFDTQHVHKLRLVGALQPLPDLLKRATSLFTALQARH